MKELKGHSFTWFHAGIGRSVCRCGLVRLKNAATQAAAKGPCRWD